METGKNVEKESAEHQGDVMRIGIAADQGGFELKEQLIAELKVAGYDVADFGTYELVTGYALSRELVLIFLSANFKGEERFKRRLAKVEALEKKMKLL